MSESAPELLNKQYAPAVERRLSRFPSREQLPIASWLIQTPIGTNYAIQILDYLDDLSRREEKSPSRLLSQVLSVLPEDRLHPKEIGQQVRDCLARQVHPVSSKHSAQFQDWKQQLALPVGVELLPPQNFEGTRFKLEVEFEEVEALRERLGEIIKTLNHPTWKKLTEF